MYIEYWIVTISTGTWILNTGQLLLVRSHLYWTLDKHYQYCTMNIKYRFFINSSFKHKYEILKGYPQKMRLKIRLYGIKADLFLAGFVWSLLSLIFLTDNLVYVYFWTDNLVYIYFWTNNLVYIYIFWQITLYIYIFLDR